MDNIDCIDYIGYRLYRLYRSCRSCDYVYIYTYRRVHVTHTKICLSSHTIILSIYVYMVETHYTFKPPNKYNSNGKLKSRAVGFVSEIKQTGVNVRKSTFRV